jgi:hypothetical protein
VSSTEQSDPGVRAAKNQSLFREVNETVAQLHHTFRPKSPEPTWVCECADLTCTERLTITLEHYAGIRESGRHFAVAAGHVVPEVERVAARLDNYWIVEKFGEAAETAEQLDPPSHS